MGWRPDTVAAYWYFDDDVFVVDDDDGLTGCVLYAFVVDYIHCYDDYYDDFVVDYCVLDCLLLTFGFWTYCYLIDWWIVVAVRPDGVDVVLGANFGSLAFLDCSS
jgi:hypothetical protein